MWYIINIISCITYIDYIDSHTPYSDSFVWRSCSTTEELSNITTQPNLSLTGDPYGIMIGKSMKFFFINSVHYKKSCDNSKCLIWDFSFTIEWRWLSSCILNYSVHVMTCINEFKRSYQCSIFINPDECNCITLIPQCSDKKLYDVKGVEIFF